MRGYRVQTLQMTVLETGQTAGAKSELMNFGTSSLHDWVTGLVRRQLTRNSCNIIAIIINSRQFVLDKEKLYKWRSAATQRPHSLNDEITRLSKTKTKQMYPPWYLSLLLMAGCSVNTSLKLDWYKLVKNIEILQTPTSLLQVMSNWFTQHWSKDFNTPGRYCTYWYNVDVGKIIWIHLMALEDDLKTMEDDL